MKSSDALRAVDKIAARGRVNKHTPWTALGRYAGNVRLRWNGLQALRVGRRVDLALSIGIAAVLSILMMLQHSTHGIGLPAQWSWILTVVQVLALGLVGQGLATGWLLGAAMQVSWISYASLTGQWGFVGGCTLSAIVQIRSYVVSTRRRQD